MSPPPDGRGFHDIGYHYVILSDGTIQTGRPENEEGAHCEHHNIDSIGICLVGKIEFTLLALESLRVLTRAILLKNNLKFESVFCHYEFDTAKIQGKTCPNLPGCLVRAYIKNEEDNHASAS